MNKKLVLAILGALVIILVIAAVAFAQNSGSKTATSGETDPKKLMIPRWFLSSLTLDGQAVQVAAGQQAVTIQFKPDSKANGTGGCNSFGADYQVSNDGKLTFGPIMSTMMACDQGMELETASFQALAKVQQFRAAEGKLTLSSSDGKTTLVFALPPK